MLIFVENTQFLHKGRLHLSHQCAEVLEGCINNERREERRDGGGEEERRGGGRRGGGGKIAKRDLWRIC